MSFVVPSGILRRGIAVAAAALALGWLSSLGTHSAEPAPGPLLAAGRPAPQTAAGRSTPSARPSAPSLGRSGSSAGPLGRPQSRALVGSPASPVVHPVTGLAVPFGYLSRPPGAKASAPPPRVDCLRVKCIALTFDDGPGPYTAKLLDMLAARHAKATFFLIGGNIRGREAVVRRELADGHAVGDHTWSHPSLSALSDDGIRSQLARTLGEIRRATGGGTTLMRPPYGATNRRVAVVTRRMGLAQILWSVDTNDWLDRNSAIVAHRAVSWARPGGIILMHDIHPTTVNAVPQILAGLARRGFTFVTVPELFGDRPPKPGETYFDGLVPRPQNNPRKDATPQPGGPQAPGATTGTPPAGPQAPGVTPGTPPSVPRAGAPGR